MAAPTASPAQHSTTPRSTDCEGKQEKKRSIEIGTEVGRHAEYFELN